MKIKFISALAILTLVFASCKKDYICECSLQVFGQSLTEPTTNTINDTKKKAEKECEGKSTSITYQEITVNNTCSIKD